VRGAFDVARQDVAMDWRSRSAEYNGLIAAPGTPKACVMPSFSITRTAAMAAFIFAIEEADSVVQLRRRRPRACCASAARWPSAAACWCRWRWSSCSSIRSCRWT
jgi:hypothetical protein